MRGDGPRTHGTPRPGNRFPPHARGWTLKRELPGRVTPVSPACAGMDPNIQTGNTASLGFPRMRGDGPLVVAICGNVDAFPRMRGDGPRSRPDSWLPHAFPPHARGWTCAVAAILVTQMVSPACAGMDRDPSSPSAPRTGFPRMRGDGPWQKIPKQMLRAFPPHARGWTVGIFQPCQLRLVSPACAGMDR